jgi:hypothetical protein
MAKSNFPVSKPKTKKAITLYWILEIHQNGQILTVPLPYWKPAWEVVISDPGFSQC